MNRIIVVALLSIAALFGLGAVRAHADYTFDVCPSGGAGIVTNVTTCPFADNVRYAYNHQVGNVITAYSPVTDRTYVMACNTDQLFTLSTGYRTRGVLCVGGANAAVVFW